MKNVLGMGSDDEGNATQQRRIVGDLGSRGGEVGVERTYAAGNGAICDEPRLQEPPSRGAARPTRCGSIVAAIARTAGGGRAIPAADSVRGVGEGTEPPPARGKRRGVDDQARTGVASRS